MNEIREPTSFCEKQNGVGSRFVYKKSSQTIAKKEQGLSSSGDINPRQEYNKTLALQDIISKDTDFVNHKFSDRDSVEGTDVWFMNITACAATDGVNGAVMLMHFDDVDEAPAQDVCLAIKGLGAERAVRAIFNAVAKLFAVEVTLQ